MSESVSLVATWFVRPGREAEAWAALGGLAAVVEATEPDTLAYLVHAPHPADDGLSPLPPPAPGTIEFFEVYRDADAFRRHVGSAAFARFESETRDVFVQSNGKPFVQVRFLTRRAGFVRGVPPPAPEGSNRHPAVMFEVIARDQDALKRFYSEAFGWSYAPDKDGFAYVQFPLRTVPLLGGIGQAVCDTPGFEPGHNFYLLVDDLPCAIERVVAAGGAPFVDPTPSDGYQFAMVKDPEGNPIGLILPFDADQPIP